MLAICAGQKSVSAQLPVLPRKIVKNYEECPVMTEMSGVLVVLDRSTAPP